MIRSLEHAAWTARRPAGLACALAAAALLVAGGARAQEGGRELPFGPGEQCVYRGSTRLGRIGTGTLAVEGGEAVNGRQTYLLRFDFSGRFGPARIEDRTRSWFDPTELASYRYTKTERSPLASRSQDVRMDPGARRWEGAGGQGGAMPTAAPLDELSFIYYIRTLRLADGDVYTLARHYDTIRNPVVVTVVGRGRIRVPAGTFQTIEVEMRVKDPAHYRGDGIVQFHFTDDRSRVPVRIESSMPVGGRMVLSLESGSDGCDIARLAVAD